MSLTIINIPVASAVTVNRWPFSATPNFFFTPGGPRLIVLTLSGDVLSSTIDTSNLSPDSFVTFVIEQDVVGGHAFNWPANFRGAQPIAQGANQVTVHVFKWTGSYFIAIAVPQAV